jgi:hypothetical protein
MLRVQNLGSGWCLGFSVECSGSAFECLVLRVWSLVLRNQCLVSRFLCFFKEKNKHSVYHLVFRAEGVGYRVKEYCNHIVADVDPVLKAAEGGYSCSN